MAIAVENRCVNPHADVNTSGWAAASGTLSRITNATGFPKITAVQTDSLVGAFTTAPGAVTPGETITISAGVKPTGAAGAVNPFIEWRDSGGAVLSYSAGTPVTCQTNVVTRVSATGVAPAGAAFAAMLHGNMFGSRQVGAVLIEEGDVANDYGDGDIVGWAWAGATGLSASAVVPEPDPDPPPSSPTARAVELGINRLNTAAFIAADPLILTLTPRIASRAPTGGVITQNGPERAPQTFKLIMQSPAGNSIEQRTDDGTERQVDFILLGEWDAEVAVGDWWDDENGNRWEVRAIVPTNHYETRAVVEAHGKVLEGG